MDDEDFRFLSLAIKSLKAASHLDRDQKRMSSVVSSRDLRGSYYMTQLNRRSCIIDAKSVALERLFIDSCMQIGETVSELNFLAVNRD